MPRYIDADAFIVDSIKNKRFVIHSEDFKNDSIIVETVYGDLLDAINNMPTIDAVEVVRCDKCIFARNFLSAYVDCTYWRASVPRNGFCYNGERKMDAEVPYEK